MKGIITDIKNNKAVLLNENSEFIYINNKNYEVGQQISYRKTYRRQFNYMAACLILFMFVSVTGYAQYYTPVSYISVDIDTASIQLEVNRFSRVINAIPLNHDAEKILDRTKVKNQNLNKSIDIIIDASKSMGHLNKEDNNVEINILTQKDKLMENINDNINKYQDENINLEVEKSNKDELELSQELNISVGKIKAIREYTDTFGGNIKVNTEKLSDFSVGDIKKIIKEKNDKQDENKVDDKIKKENENNIEKNRKDDKNPKIKKDKENLENNKPKLNMEEINKANKEVEKQKREEEKADSEKNTKKERNSEKNKNKNEKKNDNNEKKNEENYIKEEKRNNKEKNEKKEYENNNSQKDKPKENNSELKKDNNNSNSSKKDTQNSKDKKNSNNNINKKK